METSMTGASGIFVGETSLAEGERRERRRRAAMLLVDLDQATDRRLGLDSREAVAAALAEAGLPRPAAVQALCVRGLAAYLCRTADGRLFAVRFVVAGAAWVAPARGADGVARLSAEHGGAIWNVRVCAGAEVAQLAVDAVDARGRFAFSAAFIGRRRPASGWRLVLSAGAFRAARVLAARLAEALDAWTALRAVPITRLAA